MGALCGLADCSRSTVDRVLQCSSPKLSFVAALSRLQVTAAKGKVGRERVISEARSLIDEFNQAHRKKDVVIDAHTGAGVRTSSRFNGLRPLGGETELTQRIPDPIGAKPPFHEVIFSGTFIGDYAV